MAPTGLAPQAERDAGKDGFQLAGAVHVDLLPFAAACLGPDGTVLHANSEARRLFGGAAHVAQFPAAFLPNGEPCGPETHPAHRALRTGRAVRDAQLAQLGADGSVVWLRVHALPRLAAEEAEGVLLVAEDVTDARRWQDELEESEERLRLAMESVQEYAILTLDRAGYVVASNPEAIRVYGDDALGFLDRHLAHYLAGPLAPDDADALLAHTRREGKARLQGHLRRRDGSSFWGRATATTLLHEEGAGRGFVVVLEDLAEQQAREDHLSRTNAALRESREHREAFFRGVAHDLRNPLTPLRLGLAMLRRDAQTAEARRHLEIVERSAARLEGLVSDLADMVMLENGRLAVQPRPLDVGAMLREEFQTVEPLAEQQGVRLVVEAADGAVASGDRSLVGRVVANLLSNALKHSHPGGRVTARALRAGRFVRVEVEDTGEGFAPSDAAQLLRPFGRQEGRVPSASAGMGLGLALSKGIVEAHGGVLEARSPGPGRGAVFAFTLPAVEAGAEGDAAREGRAAAPRPGDH